MNTLKPNLTHLPAFLLVLLAILQCSDATTKVHIVYMGEKSHQDPGITIDLHHETLASVVGSKEEAKRVILYNYSHGFSGFAARLTESQAREIEKMPGVVRVIRNSIYKLHTTRSWDFLGLPLDSTTNLLSRTMAEDIIIGVMDTGIWPESPSFDDTGLGPVPSKWHGICQTGNSFPNGQCNRKVIGARWYIKGFLAEFERPFNVTTYSEFLSPRDATGHGSHTASISGGSPVFNASYRGLANGTARGGAPKARIAMYKVCWKVEGGQCAAADVLKAFDDAIHDGVDVLSLSLGESVPLFSDVDDRDGISTGSFHAVKNGITVVCSAGNDGPNAYTVGNVPPWIITVAAITMDRAFLSPITLGDGRTIMGQGMFAGDADVGFVSLVYPEGHGLDASSFGVCENLNLDGISVEGKVVLCFSKEPHAIGALNASFIVGNAGGVGVIVSKIPSNSVSPCTDVPCVQVDFHSGTQILFYIRTSSSPTVKLSPSRTLRGKLAMTKVGYFSSRGPNSVAPAILKPDIAAPGVNILAASSPLDPSSENGFIFHTGTSMACPHIAGIVALLKSLHPHWSPAAIKSALVTTASTTNGLGQPIFADGEPRKLADPFDYGGGIINPDRAADPGLIYDMGMNDYIKYLCAMSYNTSSISRLTGQTSTCPSDSSSILDVNLPSISIPSLRNSVTVTRTVTNVGPANSVYKAFIEAPHGVKVKVTPETLIFDSHRKFCSFTIMFISTQITDGGYYFGSLSWSDGKHVVRSPIAVQAESLPFYVNNS